MANKLFLGGLSPNTSTEALHEHFGKYGPLTDAIVMMKDGKSRGFGFVTFESPESISLVLAEEQILDDRTVDVKPAVPQGGGGGAAYGAARGVPMMAPGGFIPYGGAVAATPARQAAGPMACDKVFIGGLPQTTADETVRDYFAQYGTIIDCVVMKDKESGRSRGFGFVQYDNTDSVEAVIQDYAKHTIDGKWIEAKKAVPQNKGSGKGVAPPSAGAYAAGAYAQGGGKGAQYFDAATAAAYAAYSGAYSAAPPNYAALGYDAAAAYASFYANPAAAAYGAYGAYGAAPAAAYAAAAGARARPY